MRHDTTPPPVNAQLTIDPDTLNAMDAAEDAAANNATDDPADDTTDEPATAAEPPEGFASLTDRVIGILKANGMSSAADVKTWIETGTS